MQQNPPQPSNDFEYFIRKIVRIAAQEKMLPKMIWSLTKEFKSCHVQSYQKEVRSKYANQLRSPIVYNPEESKSELEKVQEKVTKAFRNELEVDYVQLVKQNNRSVAKFRGLDLEAKQIPFKKQFSIFRNLNQKTFKTTKNALFDQQLEIDFKHVYPVQAEQKNCCIHFLPTEECKTMSLKSETGLPPILLPKASEQDFRCKKKAELKGSTKQIAERVQRDLFSQSVIKRRDNKFVGGTHYQLPFAIASQTGTYHLSSVLDSRKVVFTLERVRHGTISTILQKRWDQTHQIQSGQFHPFLTLERRSEQGGRFTLQLHSKLINIGSLPMECTTEEGSASRRVYTDANNSPDRNRIIHYCFAFLADEVNSSKIVATVKVSLMQKHIAKGNQSSNAQKRNSRKTDT